MRVELFDGVRETTIFKNYDDAAETEARPPDRSEHSHLLDAIISQAGATSITISTSTEAPVPMQLENELKNRYPLITIDNEIFGEPRLTNHRFGVSDVLSALCVYNSFDAVIEKHGSRYTETELKDAVRFARDFLNSFYAFNEDDA